MPMREIMNWLPAQLRAIRDVIPDIRLFEIEPSGPFVVPTPGSNINIITQIHGRPDVRSYSIVGPCRDGIYRIAVKLLPDSRGIALHAQPATWRPAHYLGAGQPS